MSDGILEDVRYKEFNWAMIRFDYTSSTVQYEQYANRYGGFFIVKIDKTNGINEYYRDWTNRVTLTYKEYFEVF
jgi:hypothetical protein